jgi:hypothetical protein
MQSDNLTLAGTLDLETQTSPDVLVFNRYKTELNRSEFIRDGEAPEDGSKLTLYRTEARRNGDSRGQRKVALKLTEYQSVPNAQGDGVMKLPVILEISCSIPLGAHANTVDRLGDIIRQIGDYTLEDPVFQDLARELEI